MNFLLRKLRSFKHYEICVVMPAPTPIGPLVGALRGVGSTSNSLADGGIRERQHSTTSRIAGSGVDAGISPTNSRSRSIAFLATIR
jgi:hypothetical protein